MSTKISVEGMTCGHCEQTVEDALSEVEGVESVSADRDAAAVTVEGSAEPDVLVKAVADAGYDASA